MPGGELQPGSVEISGQSEETGFNQNVVDATIEGGSLVIAFNVRFLREVLDVIQTPKRGAGDKHRPDSGYCCARWGRRPRMASSCM